MFMFMFISQSKCVNNMQKWTVFVWESLTKDWEIIPARSEENYYFNFRCWGKEERGRWRYEYSERVHGSPLEIIVRSSVASIWWSLFVGCCQRENYSCQCQGRVCGVWCLGSEAVNTTLTSSVGPETPLEHHWDCRDHVETLTILTSILQGKTGDHLTSNICMIVDIEILCRTWSSRTPPARRLPPCCQCHSMPYLIVRESYLNNRQVLVQSSPLHVEDQVR